MKKLLRFLVRLIVISLLLIPVLPVFYRSYLFILAFVTTGQKPTLDAMRALPYVGSKNLYILAILILATPNLGIKKRLLGIFGSIALFLLIDTLMTLVWIPYFERPEPCLFNEAVSYTWYFSVRYILPFLLWFVFAFRQIEALFRHEAGHL